MMQRGVLRFYDSERGFGFIVPDSGGEDIYIPAAVMQRCRDVLVAGDRVEFDSYVAHNGRLRAALVRAG